MSLSFSSLPLDVVKYILTFEGTCILFGNRIIDIRKLLKIPKICHVGDYMSKVSFCIKPKARYPHMESNIVSKSYILTYSCEENAFYQFYGVTTWSPEYSCNFHDYIFTWEKDVGILYSPYQYHHLI